MFVVTNNIFYIDFLLETSNLEMAGLVLELLDFVLLYNYFIFKYKFYLQKRGTVMGATYAPLYTNLCIGFWEKLMNCLSGIYMNHL